MSESPKIEYKGFEITFVEHSEEWKCYTLEIEDVSLGTVKRKVDELLKKDRQMGIVALFAKGDTRWLSSHRGYQKVTVKALCVPEKDYDEKSEKIKRAWIIDKDGNRVKASLDSLYPVDNEADFLKWMELCEAADKAAAIAGDFLATIKPRAFNVDTISLAAKEAKAEAKA